MPPSPPPPPGLPPARWNPLVISIVGSICAVFLILSYYRILKRQCWSRTSLLRYRTERRLINEAATEDPSSLQVHSHGLDTSILYSLPAVQFRKKNNGETNQDDEDYTKKSKGDPECAVCLGEFEEGEWLRYLPNCTHVFHISCIDTWFRTHSNCPLCRSNVLYNLNDQQSQSVSMFTLLETLRREDVFGERGGSRHHGALSNSTFRPNPTGTD